MRPDRAPGAAAAPLATACVDRRSTRDDGPETGIGFTVALFVTELALDDEALVADAKIGILAGSILAGVIGWLIFRLAGERGGQCAPSGLPMLPPRPWRPVE